MEQKKKVDLAQIDPFTPVVKERLLKPDGKESSIFGIFFDKPEGKVEISTARDEYLLIPNEKAYQVALDILSQSGLQFEPSNTAWDGKRWRYRWSLLDCQIEPRVGDIIRLGLDVRNSYDGSIKFSVRMVAERLQCQNGMVVDFLLGGMTFKHLDHNEYWEDEVRQATEWVALSHAPERTDSLLLGINRMLNCPLDRQGLQKVFADLDTPDMMAGKIVKSIKEDNMWGLYNGFTNYLSECPSIANDNRNRTVSEYFFAHAGD